MKLFDQRILQPAAWTEVELPVRSDGFVSQAAVSSAFVSVFRGKFCDAILLNRKRTSFKKKEVLYEVGDTERTLFFLLDGFVKVGTVTSDGHEVIYDVRKGGDVIGELCASETCRPDRAVALEQTEAIPVPVLDVMEVVRKHPELSARLVDVFCQALKEAYSQVNAMAVDDLLHRLVNVLLRLARKVGHNLGQAVELSIYLTQEELSQMVAARRERVSTTLNSLRRSGAIEYSKHGSLVLNIDNLKSHIR